MCVSCQSQPKMETIAKRIECRGEITVNDVYKYFPRFFCPKLILYVFFYTINFHYSWARARTANLLASAALRTKPNISRNVSVAVVFYVNEFLQIAG